MAAPQPKLEDTKEEEKIARACEFDPIAEVKKETKTTRE